MQKQEVTSVYLQITTKRQQASEKFQEIDHLLPLLKENEVLRFKCHKNNSKIITNLLASNLSNKKIKST